MAPREPYSTQTSNQISQPYASYSILQQIVRRYISQLLALVTGDFLSISELMHPRVVPGINRSYYAAKDLRD